MSDVLQSAVDPGVAVRRVLFRHPHHEPPNFHDHARTTRPARCIRPFPGDRLAMPPQNRVGRHDRWRPGSTADGPDAARASPTGLLLLVAPPAYNGHQHEPERGALDHDGSLSARYL